MGMPITAVILDEVQVYLENPTRQLVGGTKTTLGAHIADLLTYLAKKGPAAGHRGHPGHATAGLDHDPVSACGRCSGRGSRCG